MKLKKNFIGAAAGLSIMAFPFNALAENYIPMTNAAGEFYGVLEESVKSMEDKGFSVVETTAETEASDEAESKSVEDTTPAEGAVFIDDNGKFVTNFDASIIKSINDALDNKDTAHILIEVEIGELGSLPKEIFEKSYNNKIPLFISFFEKDATSPAFIMSFSDVLQNSSSFTPTDVNFSCSYASASTFTDIQFNPQELLSCFRISLYQNVNGGFEYSLTDDKKISYDKQPAVTSDYGSTTLDFYINRLGSFHFENAATVQAVESSAVDTDANVSTPKTIAVPDNSINAHADYKPIFIGTGIAVIILTIGAFFFSKFKR